jgi:muramoyltetrapeptide carboxypeptidase
MKGPIRISPDTGKNMSEDQIIIPPFLRKGDTIGVVCPAGHMPTSRMRTCFKVLREEWGFEVIKGKTLGTGDGYFSGSDEERAADLQRMLDDDDVDAILCARGGYGVGRIIDRLDFTHFRKRPKWLIGFSDITVLHAHILSQCGVATIHGPMASAFAAGGWQKPSVQSLHRVLRGLKSTYTCDPHPLNRNGTASGILFGGNLSLLAHLVGTPSEVDLRGKILFIEDVGELLYNIDRMLYQLDRAGRLAGLAGLIVGGFTECRDTERPFGQDVLTIISEIVARYSFPVCFGFPVSHGPENMALKSGVHHQLSINIKGVRLKEA